MEDLLKHMHEAVYSIETAKNSEERNNRKRDMYALMYGAVIKPSKPIRRLPFNLSKALEGYKVEDELGREAKVVAKLSCKSIYPVVVVCTSEDGECIYYYSTEGICKTDNTKLYMVGEQETKFSFMTPVKGLTFSSEEAAKRQLGYSQSNGALKGVEIVAQVVTSLVKN